MRIYMPLVLLFILCLSGCNKDEMEGSEVLSRICPYFPDATIYKWNSSLLWIQTSVGGISDKAAAAIFENACTQAHYNFGKLIKFNITELMNLDKRTYLMVGFKQYAVTWDMRNGVDARGIPRYQVITWQQAPSWFTEHFALRPTPETIQVITLQEIQNTPKGQPIQVKTLAQIQADNKAKQEQELKDIMLKEKAEQDTSRY